MDNPVGAIEDPIKEIDYVLEYLATRVMTHRPETIIHDAYFREFDHTTLLVALNKLAKDGYATYSEDEVIKKPYGPFNDLPQKVIYPSYIISFEGLIFNRQGGYKQKLINESAENNRIDRIERNQILNTRFITWLTAIIAIGTVVAAVYYFLEILNHFYTIYPSAKHK